MMAARHVAFEPRAGAACQTGGGPAPVERRRASGGARRRPRERRAAPRPLRRPLRRSRPVDHPARMERFLKFR